MKSKIYFTMLLGFFMLSCSSNDDEIDLVTGLQLYYPFLGDVIDKSGNGFDGILYGEPELTVGVDGKSNSAYKFDGVNDLINTNVTFDYNIRSLSIWINPSKIIGSNGTADNTLTHVALSQDSNSLQYGILRIDFDSGIMKLWAGGTSGTFSANAELNKWYHLVLIRDGEVTKYYVDGTLIYSDVADDDASTYNPNAHLVIGGGRSMSNQFFQGAIDNVRIYNIVLSDEQIVKLYKKKL